VIKKNKFNLYSFNELFNCSLNQRVFSRTSIITLCCVVICVSINWKTYILKETQEAKTNDSLTGKKTWTNHSASGASKQQQKYNLVTMSPTSPTRGDTGGTRRRHGLCAPQQLLASGTRAPLSQAS
jgi:hypothetical protein